MQYQKVTKIEDESGNEDGSKDVIGIVIGIGDVVQVNSNLFKSFEEQLSLKMLKETNSTAYSGTAWRRCGMNKQAKVNPLVISNLYCWEKYHRCPQCTLCYKYLHKESYPCFSSRYEGREDYDASEFKIEMLTPEVRVVSPYVFMQGARKKMVGTIYEVELVNLICAYSKKHMNDVPELAEMKTMANTTTYSLSYIKLLTIKFICA
ncbi:hypothetical protein Tco_0490802 [Tanacetum coccineum]